MIPLLAPFFAGPLRPFGERVSIADGDRPATFPMPLRQDGLDPQWASACLAGSVRAAGCADLRALAAAWFRDYTLALLPSALVAAVLHRRSLPFDAGEMAWYGAANGRLLELVLPHDGGPCQGAMPASVPALLSPLLNHHLARVVAAMAAAARVSPRLLWCTGGVAATGVARHLATHPALDAAAREEVSVWMGRPVSADGYANPFHGAFRPGTEPGLPGVVPVRRICCLNYRLPGGALCGTCPRLALTAVPSPRARASAATAATR